jgi:hypothetical protein
LRGVYATKPILEIIHEILNSSSSDERSQLIQEAWFRDEYFTEGEKESFEKDHQGKRIDSLIGYF